MRIILFEVFGFKSEKRHAKIYFPEGRCSVIFGPNGIGKTTLLQIMSAFFSKSEDILLVNKVKKISCEIFDEINSKEYHVEVDYKEGQYLWSTKGMKFFDELKSLSIGVERGIAPQNTSINPSIIYDFLYRSSVTSRKLFLRHKSSNRLSAEADVLFRTEMRTLATEISEFLRRGSSRRISTSTEIDFGIAHLNLKNIKMENIEELLFMKFLEGKYKLNKNIQSALFDTISTLMNNPKMIDRVEKPSGEFVISIDKYKDRIKDALSENSDNRFMDSIVEILDKYCENYYDLKNQLNPVYITLFENMIKELEIEDKSRSGINVIVSRFNELLDGGKKLVISSNRRIYIDVDGEEHGINELSSGERHILTFLTLISAIGEGRNFIFIDEPEISLNLKWQRNILPLIESILPNSQIIVASHSAAISQDPRSLCRLQVDREV